MIGLPTNSKRNYGGRAADRTQHQKQMISTIQIDGQARCHILQLSLLAEAMTTISRHHGPEQLLKRTLRPMDMRVKPAYAAKNMESIMTKPLASRIALVTGASRGIGYAVALAMAKAGAHIVAVARTQGGLEELDDAIRAIGGTATLVPLDLTDFEAIARLGAALNERHGKLDILLASAGIAGPSSPLGHISMKSWNDVIAINLNANFQLIRCMEPLLRNSDAGRAVFLTSASAASNPAYRGPYVASHTALQNLARAWAQETAITQIKINLFDPGPTRTKLRATVMPGEDPETLKTPEQVAEMILALCVPEFTESGKMYDCTSRTLEEFGAAV
jgi:NAD(P)-dependent dehydrogenase (short-subunit alcohol dehydrogenase family)